ncbi:MAG: hypothetical protein ACQGTM_15535 [bacterium]
MKPWSQDEYDYLMDNWGKTSLGGIAKNLNRSTNAVKIKVARLGLGAFLESGEYVTFNELIKSLGREKSSTYMATSWIKNRGFPIKHKRVGKCSFRVVYLNDFWKWAEQNRTFIDFSKFEENTLGIEPTWVSEQRKSDQIKKIQYKKTPWVPAEDSELKRLLKSYRYSYLDLSKKLGRTCGAIQRRIYDLKLKERPVKPDNHIKWTVAEFERLESLIKNGVPYPLIAEQIGRSEKAIRGKVYVMYGSENLDKVRESLKKTA